MFLLVKFHEIFKSPLWISKSAHSYPVVPPQGSSSGVTPEIESERGPYCAVSLRGATRREAVAAQAARLRDATRALLALYGRTRLLDFQLADTHYHTPTNTNSQYLHTTVRHARSIGCDVSRVLSM